MSEADRYRTYFDEAWKKVLERFFLELLRFFLPDLAEDINFTQAVTFLDKEEELGKTVTTLPAIRPGLWPRADRGTV